MVKDVHSEDWLFDSFWDVAIGMNQSIYISKCQLPRPAFLVKVFVEAT